MHHYQRNTELWHRCVRLALNLGLYPALYNNNKNNYTAALTATQTNSTMLWCRPFWRGDSRMHRFYRATRHWTGDVTWFPSRGNSFHSVLLPDTFHACSDACVTHIHSFIMYRVCVICRVITAHMTNYYFSLLLKDSFMVRHIVIMQYHLCRLVIKLLVHLNNLVKVDQ